ncbi:MAG: glycoside hydrolase family 3 C-terminal domain-containing protein [Candidatus Eisenbacteria bacterium]|uniref:Glycoside hydrolase family 3 C-terminal domain-containing protein n=1 Tax=Eiseniibacteriota bacterium TaxID=2212470 RepID=A0A948W5N6_UNCEI|nr:glycoside hydrolase family 3 C-terminal domain-containing protein [Candidatus Eisenbacteria bacterium]MBU1951040.1 glycoside hydrolase family 3 C-terminal domain-containing protein [Candidatus Eisenbacteria bacterium]MBU2689771.1 glycoside hydrolase family 3 C-terminal domain-containing protein [Candidatus Eisenbacteria bacterium]
MTLEEKFWQLFMLAGSLDEGVARYEHGAFGFQPRNYCDSASAMVCANDLQRHFVEKTRLGIPVILFEEALHGVVQPGATSFPQAIGLAATFDTDLMREVSHAIARECRALGIRQVLSPVVNIADDVRWGRVEETYGEDPLLAADMGVAFTSGFEQQGIITTPKHFIANVGNGGRDSYPIHYSERLLREIYLPPFEACIRRGGSRSIMTSYNSLDGVPCTAGDWLNDKWLKHELGFSGFVISDACAVGGANGLHGTARDYTDATAQAIKGGLDVIFQTSFDHAGLFFPAFHEGRIPPEVIDSAVARVLRAKFELGLFDQPYIDTGDAISAPEQKQHVLLARRAAQESIVLLKNDRQTLPLNRNLKQIAVLGPDAAEARLGGYSGPGNDKVSIIDGIKNKIGPSTQIVYAEGCPRVSPDYTTVPPEFLSCVQDDTLRNGLIGSYYNNINLSGDPVFTRVDPQIQFQWTLNSPDPHRLPDNFYSVRWIGKLRAPATGWVKIGVEGNDGYRLTIDGVLVIDNWHKVSFRSLAAEHHFEEGREYDLRIEYFEPTGNARLRLVWNYGMETGGDSAINEAVALAARSDAAVVVVGIEEGEFRDRANLDLPGRQEALIQRVAAAGKPTVVVLVGGGAVTMTSWLDSVPALLHVWYPGEAGGDAVADVLFGDYNPAGRLPITFPVSVGQLPLVYNHKPTGRGDDYLDLTGQPMFPFGYGMSYTQFEYSDLRLVERQISAGGAAAVHFIVKNAGAMEGDEVVQLYIRDELASMARPVTELKGFQRIHLRAGETRALHFIIGPDMLSMLDRDLKPVVEPGDFRIMIGASCKDIRLRETLTVARENE